MATLNTNNSLAFGLRDYHHAAKTFTTVAGYPHAPYHGFLFHVFIEFNRFVSAQRVEDTKTISVMLKSADLPKFQINTETLNQYNRKRLVHTKINYAPVQLSFHDDVANFVRNIWIDYHKYNTNDPNQTLDTMTNGTIYDPVFSQAYGLDSPSSGRDTHLPLIKSIHIYSMGNHQYSLMQLVNPVISQADFDTHDYSDGSKVMAMNLGVEYESVLYNTGRTEDIPGFGDDNQEYYDTNKNILQAGNLDIPGSSLFSGIYERNPLNDLLDQLTQPSRIDPASGNVKTNKRKQVRFTEEKYFEVVQDAVSKSSDSRYSFTFPVAAAVSSNSALVEFDQKYKITQDTVYRSNAVRSNGQNIASTSTSNSPPLTTQNPDKNAILVQASVPSGLTTAELALFNKAYPPIPSTDPRSRKPPYV